MRIKPPRLHIIFISTLFVFILLLTCGSLKTSASGELEKTINENAVMPKMAMSQAFACTMSAENAGETSIVPKDEWFPKPPEPEEPEEPEIPPEDEVPPEPLTKYPNGETPYDYSKPVPETDPVGDEYFTRALFIGDSRTVGVGNWGGVSAYFYAKVALTIRGVMTIPFIEDNLVDADEPVIRTVMDTIEEYPIFEHVYIAFGLNELGWAKNAFINTYEEVVKQIQKLLPEADIYFQAVLPVSKAASDKGTNGVTNDGVREYNRQLQELAEELGCYYLAIDEIFADENGDMPADLVASDGIHFGGAVARDIMKYVRNHVVQYEDYTWDDQRKGE